MQVLFVDDEVNVLSGLRRMLFDRDAWTVHVASSARDGLDVLAHVDVDVVVSDMRMPEMDGVTFLTEVAARWPQCSRLILSGQTDELAARRALGVAHQLLAKPCLPEVLVATLTRLEATRARITDPALRRLIGGLDRLPVLPVSHDTLVRQLADPTTALVDVLRSVACDPSAATRVLQVANAPFFGVGSRVVGVERAFGRLGSALVGDIIGDGRIPTLDDPHAERIFEHSLQVAAVTAALVPDAPDEAHLVGLLHDAGLLVARIGNPNVEFDALGGPTDERAQLGATHAEIGAYCLGQWGLPEPVVDAVRRHHDVPAAGPIGLAAALQIAEAVCTRGPLGFEPADADVAAAVDLARSVATNLGANLA